MGKDELDNLVKIRQLKAEPATRAEFDGMISGAKKRLADAQNKTLASESRFDLAYGAAHGFALAALRQKGYGRKTASRSSRLLPTRLKVSIRWPSAYSPRPTVSET